MVGRKRHRQLPLARGRRGGEGFAIVFKRVREIRILHETPLPYTRFVRLGDPKGEGKGERRNERRNRRTEWMVKEEKDEEWQKNEEEETEKEGKEKVEKKMQ